MKIFSSILFLGGLLVSAPLSAGEVSAVPAVYSSQRYEGTWSSNPFLRVSRAVPDSQVSWADDWHLAGMYKGLSGTVSVTVKNVRTGELQRVTSAVTGGFKLLKAGFHRNRDRAYAIVEKAGETAILKYGEIKEAGRADRVIR